MSKKILLFGASGLLGTDLQRLLGERGFEVLAPTHAEVDLLDTRAVEAYVEAAAADVVIQSAALINVDALEKDPLSGWQVNALAAGAAARAAGKRPGTVCIQISTQYVFDGEKKIYTEDMELTPINIYGSTKAVGEELVAQYSKMAGNRYHIVRTAWIYGDKRSTFVDEVAKTLRKGEIFKATKEQYGNPTDARDLAKAIIENFIEKEAASGAYHLVNHTPEQGVSRYEIVEEIARIIGAPAVLVEEAKSDAVFAVKRPSAALVNTKLPPLRDWREALKEHFSMK